MKRYIFLLFLMFLSTQLTAQSISYRSSADKIYVGFPFTLSLMLEGFDEEPVPEMEDPVIEGAEVVFMGSTPQVSRMTTIINGVRTDKTNVVHVFSYRVSPKREGNYTIQSVTARQNGKEAKSLAATFDVVNVPESRDMRLRLVLPERKVWTGESFEIYADLYLNADLTNFNFSVPLLEMKDVFDISIPEARADERVMEQSAGGIDVKYMPYSSERAVLDGRTYQRFRFRMQAVALKAGSFDIAASSVYAQESDSFAFFRDETPGVVRSGDVGRKMVIEALPENKPESFTNAVGEAFVVDVSADRTVVNVGDPIMLKFKIGGRNTRFIDLPKFHTLPEELFSLSVDAAQSSVEVASDGTETKIFNIPVRIKSSKVREIPPIVFSFFNPEQGRYESLRTSPIALSVAETEKIGAEDVISAASAPKAERKDETESKVETVKSEASNIVLSGPSLDLALSNRMKDSDLTRSDRYRFPVWPIYVSPFVIWALWILMNRFRKRREDFAPQRRAFADFNDVLKQAGDCNYRDLSPKIHQATRELCRVCEIPSDQRDIAKVLEDFDAIAYHPEKRESKCRAEDIEGIKKAVSRAMPDRFRSLCSFCIVFVAMLIFVPFAQAGDWGERLNNARSLYEKGMAAEDRSEKLEYFKNSAAIFSDIAAEYPDIAEIWQDWGHASLNARDNGHAVLAYRRALALDPSLDASAKNLSYIRASLGESVQANDEMQKFFFINTKLSAENRSVVAALFFALFVLLLIPWSRKYGKVLRFMAIVPGILWLWLLSSVYAESASDQDAVVMSESELRSADSAGASLAFLKPLQPGTELKVIEVRNGWVRVELSGSQKGWLKLSDIERIRVLP